MWQFIRDLRRGHVLVIKTLLSPGKNGACYATNEKTDNVQQHLPEEHKEDVELNFQTVGQALSKAVESQSASELFEDDWAEEIRSYKERKKA